MLPNLEEKVYVHRTPISDESQGRDTQKGSQVFIGGRVNFQRSRRLRGWSGLRVDCEGGGFQVDRIPMFRVDLGEKSTADGGNRMEKSTEMEKKKLRLEKGCCPI